MRRAAVGHQVPADRAEGHFDRTHEPPEFAVHTSGGATYYLDGFDEPAGVLFTIAREWRLAVEEGADGRCCGVVAWTRGVRQHHYHRRLLLVNPEHVISVSDLRPEASA